MKDIKKQKQKITNKMKYALQINMGLLPQQKMFPYIDRKVFEKLIGEYERMIGKKNVE